MTRALFAALALASAAPAAAATSAATLRRPISARASAMGEAYGPVAGGLSSLGTNPAGLSAAAAPEAATTFTSGVADDAFGAISYAHPVPRGAAAAGLLYYDAGTVEIVPSAGARRTVSAQRDFVGLFGWGLPVAGGLSVGALAKPYRFELAEQFRSSGLAADLGAQWKTPLRGLTLGAAAQNLGRGVRFDRETDPLPMTLRGGASWTWLSAPAKPGSAETYVSGSRLLLVAEAIKVRDESVVAATGLEFALDFGPATSIGLRGGWRANSGADGVNLGAGLREGRYTLDYALADKRALGQVHHVTLSVRFR
jgi:hypothetical protein